MDEKTLINEKIIEFLTKEIEMYHNNISQVRSKINLSIFLGPFILLGALLAYQNNVSKLLNTDEWGWIAISIFSISFLSLGWLGGKVEKAMWVKCNSLRKIILAIRSNPDVEINLADVEFGKGNLGVTIYVIVYALLLVSFGSALFFISRL